MSAMSAAELFGRVELRDFGSPLRIRRELCACGSEIVANADDPSADVLRHNRTVKHAAWWARVRRQWQGDEVDG